MFPSNARPLPSRWPAVARCPFSSWSVLPSDPEVVFRHLVSERVASSRRLSVSAGRQPSVCRFQGLLGLPYRVPLKQIAAQIQLGASGSSPLED